ncbi:MAG: DJ-1/PfpI family protein [Bacilli bacterium]|nr:DJ-1/PfpI family protein [Bacilli bacterium]
MRILALLAPGFEDLEALGTIALLRRGKLEVDVCSVENTKTVIGKYNITVKADVKLKKVNPDLYDGLFLPGGMPGVENLFKVDRVKELVQYFVENDKVLACICAAPTIPGRLGLLAGKSYTCFPGCETECKDGIHHDVSAITDGNIITGKAAGAVHDFAYEIIKKFKGEEFANQVMSNIYYERNHCTEECCKEEKCCCKEEKAVNKEECECEKEVKTDSE